MEGNGCLPEAEEQLFLGDVLNVIIELGVHVLQKLLTDFCMDTTREDHPSFQYDSMSPLCPEKAQNWSVAHKDPDWPTFLTLQVKGVCLPSCARTMLLDHCFSTGDSGLADGTH